MTALVSQMKQIAMHPHENSNKPSWLHITLSVVQWRLIPTVTFIAFLAVHPAQADAHGAWFAISHAKVLPLQQIGKVVLIKQVLMTQRCDRESTLANAIYQLMLNHISTSGSTSKNSSLRDDFSPDVCRAKYLPLGEGRFLIDFWGIGVLDVRKRTYSPTSLPGTENDTFSVPYALDSTTSMRLYMGFFSQHEGWQGYSVFFFSRGQNGGVNVRFADLDRGGVGDDSNQPICDNEEPGPDPDLEWATSLEPPRIQVDRRHHKAVFDFTRWTKNCATGELKSEHDVLIYRNGRLFDGHGKEIEFNNFSYAQHIPN